MIMIMIITISLLICILSLW